MPDRDAPTFPSEPTDAAPAPAPAPTPLAALGAAIAREPVPERLIELARRLEAGLRRDG